MRSGSNRPDQFNGASVHAVVHNTFNVQRHSHIPAHAPRLVRRSVTDVAIRHRGLRAQCAFHFKHLEEIMFRLSTPRMEKPLGD